MVSTKATSREIDIDLFWQNRHRFIWLNRYRTSISIYFGFKKLRTAEARLYRSNSHQSRFRHFEMARSGTSSASEPPQPTAIRILDTTYARRRRLLPGEPRDIPSPVTAESVGNISTHFPRRYTYPKREELV